MQEKYELRMRSGQTSCGIVGEQTDNPLYKVGDIVNFIDKSDDTANVGIIVNIHGRFGIMGYHAQGLNNPHLKICKKIKSSYDLTPSVYEFIVNSKLIYTADIYMEKFITKMTKAEIEKELGYSIEIVY